jgi:MFS superfamily sulfate permease-like transporter
MVAGLAFIAWALRAGSLVSFISETVMLGFKAGVALHLTSTQLPKFFGFKGGHGDFWERMHYFFQHLSETNLVALAMGGGALAIILAGKVLLKNKPVALFVMIAGILLTSWLGLEGRGVKVLGEIKGGLPAPMIPHVTPAELRELFPLALACFLLSAVETVAIGRTFALKHGYRVNSNQDFLALAAANAAAGAFQAFPVAGGMSQSLVNESAGAKSSFSGFLASCIILVVVLFFSGMLHDLPQPVLAAIVLAAVTGLVKVAALKRLWHFNRGEFMVSMAALAGVLCFGLLQGVLIGAVLSVLLLLRRASRPHTTELGAVPGSTYFADLERHKENQRVPGVFVFRAGSALLYFNVEYVRDRFTELLNKREDKVELAIFYLGTSPNIDLAGAEMLEELFDSLKARGIRFKLAETRGSVRDALRKAGFEKHYGPIEANQTVAEVVAQNPRQIPVNK